MRVLTAIVVVPLLLALMFWGPVWGWYALVAFACLVGASELFGMTHPGDRVAQALGIAMTVGVSAGVYFFSDDPKKLLAVVLLVPIVGILLPLWRLGEIPTAGLRVMANVAAPFYIGALLTTIALLRRDQGELGPHYVVMTLTFAWFGDTGGYFFGRFLGKHKLYEAVSPKKTREGFFGSLVGSALGATVAHFWYLPSIPLEHALPLAVVAGALGQLGDLVESLLKRSTGIKDSGWIVPGHGGILDRIDALLIVAPLVYLYTAFRG
ncbi:MAG: phosphatidate cytidylyltransferase [Myxococcales bacterium]|nr:phosphatidate cytidylyltransferase [Myxococcales bacterium]MCB9579437.1 phosphatidate cytidylyltransferase [Polyangiaceae bacterium]